MGPDGRTMLQIVPPRALKWPSAAPIPTRDKLLPPLQGYLLHVGRHEPLPALTPLAVRSAVLGLDLCVGDRAHLRMRDAVTGGTCHRPRSRKRGDTQLDRGRKMKRRPGAKLKPASASWRCS